MKFQRSIHGFPLLFKAIIGNIVFPFSKKKHGLYVLNFHGTPNKFLKYFEEQIIFLQKHYDFISPSEFFNLMSLESNNFVKSKLLITFDDGLMNNLKAAEVLDKKGISAVFFVVPAFIENSKPKEYYLKFIRPIINPAIDSEESDFIPISWDRLKILNQKHSIGSHTMTHSMTKAMSNMDILETEIIYSKNYIEEKLGSTIMSFCSINNTLLTVNHKCKDLIHQNYKYHFTTIAGNNLADKDPLFIKRINVECFWPLGALKFSLSFINLYRFKTKIKSYKII